MQKFKGSFDVDQNNKILANNKAMLSFAGVGKYPTVTLNENKLKGNLHVSLNPLRHNSFSMTSATP